jgi:hypothetical protein
MTDDVINSLILYVRTKCRVDECLIELRNETMYISQRARNLDSRWKATGPHSPGQIHAMELIPKATSMLAQAQEVQSALNERQSIELAEIKSMANSLEIETEPNPVPLLTRLWENDEKRLTSDLASMRKLLDGAQRDLDELAAFVDETLGEPTSKRFLR